MERLGDDQVSSNRGRKEEEVEEEEEECTTCNLLKRGGLRLRNRRVTPKTTNNTPLIDSSLSTKSVDSTLKENESVLNMEDGWEMEQPPDSLELGRSGWTLLHTIAAYYPDNPSLEQKENTSVFLDAFSKVYPCTYCAQDFQGIIARTPPKLDNRKEFSLWMCEAHNDVNKQLGKPEFDCNKVDKRWRF